jgi:catechol 2,3-dioxygenase-like lactoylglutathione lyase family enzyme
LITGFDHVVIAVNDIASAVAQYETLLGASAATETHDGIATASFATQNLIVELMAPVDLGPSASRLRTALQDGEGLKSVVFAIADIEAAHRRCKRVGLEPEEISDREGWRSFRADTERTNRVRLFFLQRREAPQVEAGVTNGLDHIVVRTGDADRAAALYGARLGLDMRLDRKVAGRRLMFFRCGDAIVEIVHDPSLDDGRDKLWGLSWRVADADAARERLAGAGVDVSDVRTGMKPGTRVFTVRNNSCGVPTLMIEASRRD